MTPEEKTNPAAGNTAATPAVGANPAGAGPHKPETARFDGDMQELKATPEPIEPAAPLPGSIGSVKSGAPLGEAADVTLPPATTPEVAASPAAVPEAPVVPLAPAPEAPVPPVAPAPEATAAPASETAATPTAPAVPAPEVTPAPAPVETPAPAETPLMGAVDLNMPTTPETMPAPETAAPEAASNPETPVMPEAPVSPEAPVMPEAPVAPETPVGATPEAYANPDDALAPQVPVDAYPPVAEASLTDQAAMPAGDKPKSNKTRLILLIVLGLVVLVGAGFGVFWLISSNSQPAEPETATPAPEPEPEPEPQPEPTPSLLTCTYVESEEGLATLGDDVTAFQQQYDVDFDENGYLTQITNVSYITYTSSEIAEARLATLQRSYEDFMVNNLSLDADPFTSTYVVASTNNLQAIVTHSATSEVLNAQNAAFFDLGIETGAEINTGDEQDLTTDTNSETVAVTADYLNTLAAIQERYESMNYTCEAQ